MADNYSGATTAALVITGVTNALNGNLYRCRATNEYGAVASESAELTVGITPPSECGCALQIPFAAGIPYANLAAAETAIADYTAGCIAWTLDAISGYPAPSAFSSSFASPTISSSITIPSPNFDLMVFHSVSLPAGANLSISWAGSTDGTSPQAAAYLLNCDGSQIDSDGSTGLSGSLGLTAPASGSYVLQLVFTSFGATLASCDFAATADSAFAVNPVIALWDDSGTTRELEACPKMVIPPQLGSTLGSWYSDQTEAQDAINNQTDACVAYFGRPDSSTCQPASISFSATNGGSSVSMAASLTTPDPEECGGEYSLAGYCSINAEAGEAITGSGNYSRSDPGASSDIEVRIEVYAYDGSFVDDDNALGGGAFSLSSSALPYTGKYYVLVFARNTTGPQAAETISWDSIVTSSGTTTVNNIQALYDVGLDCPSRLDC